MPKTLAVRAHKSPFHVADADATYADNLIGNNVGNLVFSQATYRLLSRDDQRVERLNPAATGLPEGTDVIVLPLANAFRWRFIEPMRRLTALIRSSGLPVMVLGVGSQARIDKKIEHDPDVDEAAREFLAAVLDHGPSIGVRGEHTRDELKRLGFGDEHVDVIGCPSMFMFGPDLPATRDPGTIDRDTPLAFNSSPYRKLMGPISLHVAREYPNARYFAQEIEALEMLLHGTYTFPGTYRDKGPMHLDHPLVAHDQIRLCLDPRTWMSELAQAPYSFGSRIHGNITALLSGTPATVLVHDTRTAELVDLHRIPSLPLKSLQAGTTVPDIVEASDWAPMHADHQANWERFEAFLHRHDLQHSYDPGGDPSEFDARLDALDLPPAVRTVRQRPLEELYAWKRTAEPVPTRVDKPVTWRDRWARRKHDRT